MIYRVDCGQYGSANIEANNKPQAKYRAFIKWIDAYRVYNHEYGTLIYFVKKVVKSVKRLEEVEP